MFLAFIEFCQSSAKTTLPLINPITTVIEKTIEDDVITFFFEPNCTHLFQPLDRKCFSDLESEWLKACQSYMAMNPGEVIYISNLKMGRVPVN
jgi:hypothetical protein